MFSRLYSFLRGLFRRREFENDLTAEINSHIDNRAEDLSRSGFAESDARRQARIEFGSVEVSKEQCRQSWGLRFVDDLRGDLRYALRSYGKKPLFPIIVIVSLAFGLGTNTALFTFIDNVILRPLPVTAPGSLYDIVGRNQARNQLNTFSYSEYENIRDQNRAFRQVFAYSSINPNTPNGSLLGLMVSGNYFDAIGIQPVMGRAIIPADDSPSSDPVVVISNFAWQHHFGSDSDIVGKRIEMAGHNFTVVGVGPVGFFGLDPQPASFWVPLSARQLFTDETLSLNSRSDVPLRIVGRLKPEFGPDQAQASLSILVPKLTESRDEQSRLTDAVLKSHASILNWGYQQWVNFSPLPILFTAVLFIAWSNLAGVQLSRMLNRQHEISIRLSVGAARGRLIRQLVIEVVPVIMIGTVMGLLVSHWLYVLGRKLIPETYWEFTASGLFDDRLDPRIFSYVLFMALLSVVTIGLLPAFKATRINVASALKGEGSLFGRGISHTRLRNWLIILQFTITMALLVVAGALVRFEIKIVNTQLGYDGSHSLHIQVTNKVSRDRLMRTLSNIPGVIAVAGSFLEPPSVSVVTTPVSFDAYGKAEIRVESSSYNQVTADYFNIYRIPTAMGRTFTDREVDSDAEVAVVSMAAARHFWPNGDALGKRLQITLDRPRNMEVIGVVGNIREPGADTDLNCVYLPKGPNGITSTYLVSVNGNPALMLNNVHAAITSEYPSAQFQISTVPDEFFVNTLVYIVQAITSGVIGIIGLILASIGIYGIVASTVSRRTREIGIRMALGAERMDILRLIIKQGFRPILIAIFLGSALCLLLSPVLTAAFVFRYLHLIDPLVMFLAVIVLCAIGTVAIYLPARKATRIEPSSALRYE